MDSILNNSERENFYIRLYFNIEEGFDIAGIKRAYLDFNRTLPIPKNCKQSDRDEKLKKTVNFLNKKLKEIIQNELKTQNEFDILHENLCKELTDFWDELKIGQSQKWINMSLKYWLLFGENRIKNIEKNAKFFHIPIDGIIQKVFFGKNLPPWSKIVDYKEYFNYQLKFREDHKNSIPIVEEFREFNKS